MSATATKLSHISISQLVEEARNFWKENEDAVIMEDAVLAVLRENYGIDADPLNPIVREAADQAIAQVYLSNISYIAVTSHRRDLRRENSTNPSETETPVSQ